MKTCITIELSPKELSKIIQEAVYQGIQDTKELAPKSEKLLDRKEVKFLLKISSDTTVISFEKKGILHPVKVGKKVLYRQADVQEALQKIHR